MYGYGYNIYLYVIHNSLRETIRGWTVSLVNRVQSNSLTYFSVPGENVTHTINLKQKNLPLNCRKTILYFMLC